jgi:hypothetical protein
MSVAMYGFGRSEVVPFLFMYIPIVHSLNELSVQEGLAFGMK